MARLSGIQRIMEVGMILSCAFAFFILLALASFNSADPSWSQAGFQGNIHNWVGPIGAWFADVLFFSFGRFAYILPFIIAFTGWFLFQQVKRIEQIDYLTIGLRIIGSILFLVGISGILSINFDDIFHFSAGGMIGDVISSSLIPYFSLVGTTLLLLCFLLTGITLVTGISLVTVVDKLGEVTILSGLFLYRTPKLIQQSPIARLTFKSASNETSDNDVEITTFKAAERATPVEPTITIPEEIFEQPKPEPKPSILSVSELKKKITGKKEKQNTEQPEPFKAEPTADIQAETIPKQTQNTTAPHLNGNAKPVGEVDDSLGPLPSFDLLERADKVKNPITQEELDIVSRLVEEKLLDFNIEAKVVGVFPGPVITRFELDLAPGVKVSRITALSKDLARAMSAMSVRVVEVIPGKSVIGLELPNKNRDMVRLSEVIACQAFQGNDSPLTMVLGADISGKPVIVDLAKMPHLLVAGTTGSGKSVGVNVMILSLLYKSSPEDVRMIMIDPKMLELSVYEGIPHLLSEVVTDMKEAANALRWCVGEMERRYRLMSALGVRNLKGYNAKIKQAIEDGQPIKDPLWRFEESMETVAPDLEKLPAIVVVVDEFADMMMIVGKKVEELIARIAQKARAAGIHLVLATQRPSVDVITGLIKANIPTRIAFQVSSKIDSRTILDQQGAESLLGMGDMLYLPPGTGVPTRVHGAFVDDHEVHAVVADWKKRGEPNYIDEILNGESSAEVLLPGEQPEGADQEFDAFYDEAVAFITESRRASVSSVQRKFRIGYNRAARLVEQMEQSGVVSAAGHNGTREVLAPPPPKD
ncbi:DNA translocase FtsK 4TM domain-containing protein [Aliiglaciecola sp. 2_MG-2023]|uniref:DNA translocase FtsK n=1 Tax=unclassified Aliiglaciecola TaxID=2593648 RepID=UPI0026E23798|nr:MULTISPECIES: DNA translocase FtsK 4TM domain-containing protein [unclassified Aliiglaciecola]MDO6712723.1 DNA translocase FtsK 4TM domain-containing protein [Aliiglaciecola sp. 2_MG-2023]MDO6753878.1 DNA translocase FtsK 4TM domain-containing protein [Aliiglaciecola sp. 1_MG-2023]